LACCGCIAVIVKRITTILMLHKKRTINNIIALEVIGFLSIIFIVWINEISDLPHFILGAPVTPINYNESIFESILIFCMAFCIIFLSFNMLQKIKNFQIKLEKSRNELEQKVKERTNELESRNMHFRELTRQTVFAMENERKAMSKEIHDSIGGSLAGIKMLLESRLMESNRTLPDGFMPLGKIIDHLTEVIEESKHISYQMHPPLLDDCGLAAALSEYFKYFKEFYPDIEIVSHIDVSNDISDDIKTVIYRVVQEALNNIGKHSGAHFVKIEITECNNLILLKIRDNGCGFKVLNLLDMNQTKKGFGMRSMKERTEICNGTFQLKSEPGSGTLIIASIPKAMM
jgi:signal transduction histidine kinase